ncbi:MAG: GNAT family N-acetyltransferase [Clostridia bacterium]|nr:GNAT family N-acetyltransferase [Clostridia bacterium]
MKIIREKDMTHEIFHKEEISEHTLEIYRFEDPEGYLYINKGKEGFSVHIHSLSELILTEGLKEILTPYLSGKTSVSVSSINTDLIEFLKSKGQVEWFGYYSLVLDGDIKTMTRGSLQPYNEELDTYIDIFGRCFEPMRALHDFKPHDWYKNNREIAKKEFEEANKEGNFYGYVIEGEIVGGGIAVENELDLMAIKPELQCNGLGRQLLRGIVHEMKKKNNSITIGVVESNQHVLRLYRSEGFVIERYEKKFKNY